MKTAPVSLDTVSKPANRSPVFAARVRTAASWASPSTLMPSIGTPLSFGHVVEVFCTQNDTSGGSRDTGTKVLAAKPSRTPSTWAAMATTPVGKWPKASRSDVGVRLLFIGLHAPLEPENGILLTDPTRRVLVCGSHIGMGPQSALPGVAPVYRKDGIRGVFRRAPAHRGACRQFIGQRQHGYLRVQARIEEVRHRDPV